LRRVVFRDNRIIQGRTPIPHEAAVLLNYDRRQRKPSLLAFCGALLAAAAVGLGAYAAHGVTDAHAQSNLQAASLYAFGHGIALAALAASTTRTLGRLALYVLLLGSLLFCGSLALNATAGVSSRLAPLGGMGMMAGWVLWAFDALRR
jgi:Uncharacterized small membrane protein